MSLHCIIVYLSFCQKFKHTSRSHTLRRITTVPVILQFSDFLRPGNGTVEPISIEADLSSVNVGLRDTEQRVPDRSSNEESCFRWRGRRRRRRFATVNDY